MDDLEKLPDYRQFSSAIEQIKRTSNGSTYWMAREVQITLGYARWEDFRRVLTKAQSACESAGVDPANQFRLAPKMVDIGSGAKRESEDWFLSRYACYMIAMSGDGSKKEISYAKTYFAVQTRRQEVADQSTADERRVRLRERVKDNNLRLNEAAKHAGVQKYAVFHDAGYKGLYGLGQSAIKAKKGIDAKESLLDCIGPTELAANDFRITQAKDKLERERVATEEDAFRAHRDVGAAVRNTIKSIGGTMPEELRPEPPIRKLIAAKKKALKGSKAKSELNG